MRARLERLHRDLAAAERLLASQRRLLEVNERLLATLDPTVMLELIADSLRQVVAYDNLTIYRVDRAAGLLRAELARDRFAAAILGDETPLDALAGISGWVLEHGEAQCVNDAHLDPRACQIDGTPAEPESVIVVPLVADGRVEGTLNVGRVGGREAHFAPAEFELCRLFAVQASAALRNAEAHRAEWLSARTDPLTGLRNRGALEAELERRCAERAGAWSLVMVDLDEFKECNDRHGHRAGDEVLRAVGRAIAGAIRQNDVACRYGGDEFAVVLPSSGRDAALEVGRRIAHAVRLTPSVADARVTASVGVATCPADGTTMDAIVRSADRALYAAKEAGGDRAVAAPKAAGGAPAALPGTRHAAGDERAGGKRAARREARRMPEAARDRWGAAVQRTRELFLRDDNRYGCAESAFVALAEAYGCDVRGSAPAMALNGGIAYSGGTCGALTGAALALGTLAEGRLGDHGEAKRVTRMLTVELMESFAAAFGSTQCRALIGRDISTPEGHAAFIESGAWRTTCMAQIEHSVGSLAPLADPDAWRRALDGSAERPA